MKNYTETELNSLETFTRLYRGLLRIQGRPDPNMEIVCRNLGLDLGEFTAFIKHHFGSPSNIKLVQIKVLERKLHGDAPGEPTGEDAPEIELPVRRRAGRAMREPVQEPDPAPETEVETPGGGRKRLTDEERKERAREYARKAYAKKKKAAQTEGKTGTRRAKPAEPAASGTGGAAEIVDLARLALQKLGYRWRDTVRRVDQAMAVLPEGATVEQVVKAAMNNQGAGSAPAAAASAASLTPVTYPPADSYTPPAAPPLPVNLKIEQNLLKAILSGGGGMVLERKFILTVSVNLAPAA